MRSPYHTCLPIACQHLPEVSRKARALSVSLCRTPFGAGHASPSASLPPARFSLAELVECTPAAWQCSFGTRPYLPICPAGHCANCRDMTAPAGCFAPVGPSRCRCFGYQDCRGESAIHGVGCRLKGIGSAPLDGSTRYVLPTTAVTLITAVGNYGILAMPGVGYSEYSCAQ